MKNMILLTNEFPYGNWEAYLETEVNYYQKFDKVFICSLQLRKEHKIKKREICLPNTKSVEVDYAPKWVYLLYSFRTLFDVNLYSEIIKLVKQKRFSFRRLVKMVVFLSRSYYECHIILKELKKEGIVNNNSDNTGVIYAYRFEYQPYLGILLNKRLTQYKNVARAHRIDLYETESKLSYLPLREYILEHLDKVYLIAEDGKRYLSERFPKYKEKMDVSRLGTINHYVQEIEYPIKQFTLISCSTIYSVKRVNLIAEALSHINDKSIRWIHYGEGPQFEELKKFCSENLQNNIEWCLAGYVDNKELLEKYKKEQFHIFINVSTSEGIPVSIMEALSFGVPCIATDVGGTSEIVEDHFNGILLDKDFTVEKLVSAIYYFYNMSEYDYQKYRDQARKSWNEKYNADKNYSNFVNDLLNIE